MTIGITKFRIKSLQTEKFHIAGVFLFLEFDGVTYVEHFVSFEPTIMNFLDDFVYIDWIVPLLQ